MNNIEQKLAAAGYQLPPAKPAVGNYLGSKRAGNLLYASGRVSDQRGMVGKDVNEAQAKEAARDTALLILGIVKQDIGDLDKIKGVVKMQGFILCNETVHHLPGILDGASDILIMLFGEEGHHARTATGVAQLPFGATVQLDIIFELHI